MFDGDVLIMQGVVNVVMGNASDIGEALLSSPKVDFSFGFVTYIANWES